MAKASTTIDDGSGLPNTIWRRLRHVVIGHPKDPHDPTIAHKLSLIALLAWVGLGADGLSSSAYGPPEAFKTLFHDGQFHAYLAILIALATAATVFIISYAYSRIIEHFPSGGGGYVVATALLGHKAGVISGCALLVDYVLTITTSIGAGGDAIFSLLPHGWAQYKLYIEFGMVIWLTVMNMRGVKESVTLLVPIFLTFLVTHAVLILGALIVQAPLLGQTTGEMHVALHHDLRALGVIAIGKLFLRAYSMGAGTYTGIEAVSNGLGIMRQPQVETGKRTMGFMALSLALTAGGLLLCYALVFYAMQGQGTAVFQEGRGPNGELIETLNSVLARHFAGSWRPGGIPLGMWFCYITIASEALLLLVAAQTGFIDGPRVMSNMATDSWLPRRFAALSERLTMQNGIVLMGAAAFALLLFTRGNVDMLVVMYAINVFVTFSLSEFGMSRFWIRSRRDHPTWRRHLAIHGTGLVLCLTILTINLVEKFHEGAWATVVITAAFIGVCVAIRAHYNYTAILVKRTDALFAHIADTAKPPAVAPHFDAQQHTAVLLVKGYNGLGIHTMLSIFRLFPNAFRNIAFVCVGVVDSGLFKGSEQVEALEQRTRQTLANYVELARKLGIPAKSFYRIGTDVVSEASELCVEVATECPNSTFFAGEVLFGQPRWYDKMLHNDVAYAIQRRIRFVGLSMVILPMLVQQVVRNPEAARAVPRTVVSI
jgi:amino acid transporter